MPIQINQKCGTLPKFLSNILLWLKIVSPFLFNIATTHHTWQLDTSHAILNQICDMKNGTKIVKNSLLWSAMQQGKTCKCNLRIFFSLCSKRKQRLRLNYWTEENGTFSPGIKKKKKHLWGKMKKRYMFCPSLSRFLQYPNFLVYISGLAEEQKILLKELRVLKNATLNRYLKRTVIIRSLYTFYPLFEVHLCTVTFGLFYG